MERQGLALTDPETVGMSGARLERLCAYLQGAVDCGAIPLADIAIVRHSALVCRRSFLNSTLVEQGHRLTPRSRYYLGSFTKIFVATLVIQQVERGAIMLTRPAADYVPAFAARGKGAVTVRHLLAHASGLPDELAVPLETQMPLPELVAEVCAQPLVFAPGTRSSYCTWGFVILAGFCAWSAAGRWKSSVVTSCSLHWAWPTALSAAQRMPPNISCQSSMAICNSTAASTTRACSRPCAATPAPLLRPTTWRRSVR